MYQEFTLRRRPPIYDPKEFQIFCRSAGAPTIFDTILNAMTDLRHSQLRLGTNEKRTVAIIYKLCYGVSQVCNWLQTDHVLFLKESNLNQRVFEAQREMGNSCCRRRVNILHAELAESNTNKIGELISEAIKEQWQLVLSIDHYTSVHSKRRPKTDQLCHLKSMCTIVVKVFKNVKTLPLVSRLCRVHPQCTNWPLPIHLQCLPGYVTRSSIQNSKGTDLPCMNIMRMTL